MSGPSSTNLRSRRQAALRAVGALVGQRWTLLGVIGRGGTGTVYEAVHRNGSRVAVKLLHPEFVSNERIRRRFLAEGYAANRVQHDGAVKVLDDGETDDGGAYLVMELLEGETLAARLVRDGALPAQQVLSWGIAVLEILDAAHEHHVVHRDVKPSNIFITRRGQVKLLDFGIARVAADSADDELLTQHGVALGTPAFMAPEQATGSLEEIGAVTDIWGVGATLFQLLTGRPLQGPRGAGSLTTPDRAPPPLRAFAPNVAPELAKVVDRALNLRPSDRWPTARAMMRALELVRDAPALPNDGGAETLTEEVVLVPKPAATSRRVTVAAVGCALALAGAFHWMLTQPRIPLTPAVSSVALAPSGKAPAELVWAARSSESAATAPVGSLSDKAPASHDHSARASLQPHGPNAALPRPAASKTSSTDKAPGALDSLLDRRN